MSLKAGENVGSRLDSELLGVSSRSKLFAYGTTVVGSGMRVNTFSKVVQSCALLN